MAKVRFRPLAILLIHIYYNFAIDGKICYYNLPSKKKKTCQKPLTVCCKSIYNNNFLL